MRSLALLRHRSGRDELELDGVVEDELELELDGVVDVGG
jgi:hypothetical protein